MHAICHTSDNKGSEQSQTFLLLKNYTNGLVSRTYFIAFNSSCDVRGLHEPIYLMHVTLIPPPRDPYTTSMWPLYHYLTIHTCTSDVYWEVKCHRKLWNNFLYMFKISQPPLLDHGPMIKKVLPPRPIFSGTFEYTETIFECYFYAQPNNLTLDHFENLTLIKKSWKIYKITYINVFN